MPFVEYPQAQIGFKIKGRIGRPAGCGHAMCGWSVCGDTIDWSGLYQQRRNRSFNSLTEKWEFGKARNFVMRPYWPVQPASVAREAQQDRFKTALSAWQALTDEQKAGYNEVASRRSKRGYDYFMSKYLKSF